MKTPIAAAFAAGAALGVGLWLRAPSAAAQTPHVVDHKVIYVSYDDYKDTEVFKKAEKDLGNTYLAVLRMQEMALTKLGQEGWELVQVEAKTPAQTTFYLKRRP